MLIQKIQEIIKTIASCAFFRNLVIVLVIVGYIWKDNIIRNTLSFYKVSFLLDVIQMNRHSSLGIKNFVTTDCLYWLG